MKKWILASIGATAISLGLVVLEWWIAASFPGDDLWWDLRAPRVLSALLAGYALGHGGLLLQGLTRNPLTSPSILGLSSGAALSVALVHTSSLGDGPLSTWSAAFGGALATGALVMAVAGWARPTSGDPSRLLLSGVLITGLLTALTQMLILLDEDRSDQILYWLVGGLGQGTLRSAGLLGVLVLGCAALHSVFAKGLDLLSWNETGASALGVPVGLIKTLSALMVALLAAGAVAVVGPISFVGFMAPHLARTLGFRHYQSLAPASGLIGGGLLLLADHLAQLMARPYEAPAGIITGCLGSLIFLAVVIGRSAREVRAL